MPPIRRALLAAAGLLLGGSATAQLVLDLDNVEPGSPLLAGSELRLVATLPARSESGLAPELPAVWIDDYRGRATWLSDDACAARVEGLEKSLTFSRPLADLQAYQLATISQGGVISVLDPRGGFGSSRLLDRLDLGAEPGALWHDSQARRLWVSLPSRHSLLVIDTATWKIVRELAVGGRATALGPATAGIWATTDAQDPAELLFFGPESETSGQPAARLSLPGPASQVLAVEQTLFAIIGDGRLFRHAGAGWQDLRQPAKLLAFSPAAEALVVLQPEGGLSLLELAGAADGTNRVMLRAALPAARIGDSRLDLSPDGRWAIVWSPAANDLRVADLARQVWRGELRVEAPAEIAFSERFFYVRSAARAEVLVTPLASLDAPGMVAGKLVAGGTQAQPVPRLASMAAFPEGETVFWASAADQQVYAYHEGMNAASGSLRNPEAAPMDLLLTGPLLRQVATGIFAARVVLPRPGKYLVAAKSRQPYAVACRLVEVAGENGPAPLPTRLVNPELPQQWPARRSFRLRFELSGSSTILPAELPVVVMTPSGTWQGRFRASSQDGQHFEAELEVPTEGPHFVVVSWQDGDGQAMTRRFAIEILASEMAGATP